MHSHHPHRHVYISLLRTLGTLSTTVRTNLGLGLTTARQLSGHVQQNAVCIYPGLTLNPDSGGFCSGNPDPGTQWIPKNLFPRRDACSVGFFQPVRSARVVALADFKVGSQCMHGRDFSPRTHERTTLATDILIIAPSTPQSIRPKKKPPSKHRQRIIIVSGCIYLCRDIRKQPPRRCVCMTTRFHAIIWLYSARACLARFALRR